LLETELELTIKAVTGGWRVVEVPISPAERPRGSHSKIRALRDGMAILGVILGRHSLAFLRTSDIVSTVREISIADRF